MRRCRSRFEAPKGGLHAGKQAGRIHVQRIPYQDHRLRVYHCRRRGILQSVCGLHQGGVCGLSEAAWRSPSGDAAVYENCHANSNLSEYYDPARATARSRGSVSTSGITALGHTSTPSRGIRTPATYYLLDNSYNKCQNFRRLTRRGSIFPPMAP